jgi:hypothetical protein
VSRVAPRLAGFDDPLLLTAAQGAAAAAGAPEAYRLAPWLYRPSLALSFSTREEPLEYFSNLTGSPYDYSQLSWNSSDLGGFLPLIQQKRMRTGRRQGSAPQDMLQYRGLPFANKTWGILNVTGVSEGVAFGNSFDPGSKPVAWDSVLSRPMQAEFTGAPPRPPRAARPSPRASSCPLWDLTRVLCLSACVRPPCL